MTTPQQTTLQASALEKDKLTLGYMPLTDALPLIAAQEMGYFRHAGLNVTLQQEVSWANIRDKVIVGHFDAAQMLAPMLLATHLGIGCLRKPMQAPMSLALNGNALTVSNTLAETLAVDDIASASAKQLGQQLAKLIRQRQQNPQGQKNEQEKLVFAVVFPFSIHNLLMRDWLADAGIDPDKDIELLVLPPSQMVDHLKLQHIDGFFAGAPWNSVAIQQGVGQCLMPATKLWQQAPDKVLGVTQEWAQQHPNTLQALIQAISQGAQWCHDHPEKAAELLAEALEQPTEALLPALTGEFSYKLGDSPVSIHNMLVLDPLQAGEAKVEHGEWFLQQMQRWGWIQADTDIKHVAQECFSSH